MSFRTNQRKGAGKGWAVSRQTFSHSLPSSVYCASSTAPTSPPQNVSAYAIDHRTVHISWRPPLMSNGRITVGPAVRIEFACKLTSIHTHTHTHRTHIPQTHYYTHSSHITQTHTLTHPHTLHTHSTDTLSHTHPHTFSYTQPHTHTHTIDPSLPRADCGWSLARSVSVTRRHSVPSFSPAAAIPAEIRPVLQEVGRYGSRAATPETARHSQLLRTGQSRTQRPIRAAAERHQPDGSRHTLQ